MSKYFVLFFISLLISNTTIPSYTTSSKSGITSAETPNLSKLFTLRENSFVCHECLFHFRISSDDYIHLLIDNNEYEEFSKNIISCDPLKFTIPKDYSNQFDKYNNNLYK